MKGNKRLDLAVGALMILFILGLTMFTTPVTASTTTYTGNGDPRPILERANRLWSGSAAQNNTQLVASLPGGGWEGYQLSTTFTNIARNADYVVNGGFDTSSSPWALSSTSTSYLSGDWAGSPPSGTTTGSDYIRLQGNTTILTPIQNMNLTSSSSWTPSTSENDPSNKGTPNNNWDSALNEWEQRYTISVNKRQSATASATMICDQNFTYNGLVPPEQAVLNYIYYIKYYSSQGTPPTTPYSTINSFYVRLILTYYSGSGPVDHTIVDYTATGITSKWGSPAAYDITSYITGAGTYRVRLYADISMSAYGSSSLGAQADAAVHWDDVGVYIRYGKYSAGSHAEHHQTWNFAETLYTLADGKLSFKYYTNVTTVIPSTDSYISAWINSTKYNIVAFSSVTTGSWQTATLSIPVSAINKSTSITFKIGVYAGSNLEIQVGNNPRFYFDNITFYIKNKPTPQAINLRIYDVTQSQNYPVTTGTPGQGTLTITPASLWTGASVIFNFSFSYSGVTFSYSSTMYAVRSTQTDSVTFTVHDDTNTAWTCQYDTPNDIGGYTSYNATIYVPSDWIQSGKVDHAYFPPGTEITDYTAVQVNSSTWMIKIPATDFPNPPCYVLEIRATSANYLGPSAVRTLLYTQCNTTSTPPYNWKNATYFIPKNITKLVGVIRDGSYGIPVNVDSFQAVIRLYNDSATTNKYTGKSWSRYPNSTGKFSIELNPWGEDNVTWCNGVKEVATEWYFAVNWTNGYEAANAIAHFTTNSTISLLESTSLTAPGAPYQVPYGDGFTLSALYRKVSDGSGVTGAHVTWRWSDQGNVSTDMTEVSQGYYTANIGNGSTIPHYGPYSIQINATKSGCVSQSIMVQITVRNVTTIGTAASFVVPYETFAWNTTLLKSLTYWDVDHNKEVAGATLFVNKTYGNATNVGSSGIRWWYRYVGGGSYSIYFNATPILTGTNAWSFNITATKPYHQTQKFNLNGFYIRDRQTTHTEPSLSVTTPYGGDAVFRITYRDTDAGGAIISGPGVSATCTWTNPYTVTLLSNGTYKFTLNATGLIPGNYSFSFQFTKDHWASITITNVLVRVRYIYTTLSSPTTQLSMYWGDNATAVLTYEDIDHASKIPFASWDSVTAHDTQTGIDYSLNVYNIFINPDNTWTLRLNATLGEGNYTLRIRAYVLTANGYYVDGLFTPSLTIKSIATSSSRVEAALSVIWSDPAKIVVKYNDTYGRLIPGASVGVLISSLVSWSFYDNGSGLYTIFFNTTGATESAFAYSFSVQLSKLHHAPSTVTGDLLIRAISTTVQITPPEPVTRGNTAIFQIRLFDTDHNIGVTNATITIVGLNSTYYTVTELGSGNYTITLKTDWASEGQKITFTVSPQKDHYTFQGVLVTYNLAVPGVSPMWVLIAGGGGGGAVFLVALGVYLYRRAKIPFVIKKINQILSLVNKGEHEQATTPVPLKTREESIEAITQRRIDAFTMKKPTPSAPPVESKPPTKAGVEEAAPAAAPPEVEAALKRELKAVEPGKPEEEIEEVEMETLDEELGRLEKIDTGQEVPEGAKQARDIIDEYKKRKKKW
nr:hypothetical protein [Candidatus Njordarchaeota archaeon]